MSRMAESFFSASPLLALPIVSMLLFGAIFVAIVLRAYRTSNAELDRQSALPFSEDSDV